jgi:hypothetical protein
VLFGGYLHEMADDDLVKALSVLRGAVGALRAESGRLANDLDSAAVPLKELHEPQLETAPAAAGAAAEPAGERPGSATTADASAPAARPAWRAPLLAALSLIGSAALLDVHLAAAAALAVAAAIALQVRWWMPALAALSLTFALAVDSGVSEGPFVDEIGGLVVIFILLALGLLLYEAWERLR